ncbi:MAG: EAL domain-containing protein [Lachnospiraceae bacterium]|nr:EAL domain-containing protein [Lachnospiraceae bacterium]
MGIITQMCGIVICMILAFFYKQQRKLDLDTQNAFVRVWNLVFLGLVLDITSILMIRHEDVFSHTLAMIVCNAYLLSILWKQVFGVLYIDTYISEQHDFKQKETWGYMIYGIIGSIVIIVTPISGMMDRGRTGYHFGQATITAYILAILLLVRMLWLLTQHRRQMTRNSRRSAYYWVVLCLGATVVQFFNNELMIAGFFSAIGIMMIYLKLENPERFIDSDTGFFNKLALKRCMRQLNETGESVTMIYFNCEQIGHQRTVIDREIRLEVYNFFDQMKKIYPFRGIQEGIVIAVREKEYVLKTIKTINERFEKPWGKYKDVYLKPKMIYLEDTNLLKSALDVKKIFSFVRNEKKLYDEEDMIFLDENIISEAYKEDDVEDMIMDSIKNHRVEVYYQPIYSTISKTFESAEALVRIRKEDGSIIMPGGFIEVAEKRGSILPLGAEIFDKVCQFIEEHNMKQMGLHYIEINLSAVQGSYKNLADDLIKTMERHHVDPHCINLEITESASMKNDKIFLDNMYSLKNYGVSFSLDDFGTGQSNLNYIVAMPVDIVKFDRGMTLSYFENAKAKHVMDAAMTMIKGMNLEIVSEGIENEEQLKILEELGIQYIQGYYFSKPLPENKFVEFIRGAIGEKA